MPAKAKKPKIDSSFVINDFLLNNEDKFLLTKLEEHYNLKFPSEIIEFWRFCVKQCSANPLDALKSLGVRLCGPFNFLNGQSLSNPHLHCRFYYDVPEFQTLFVSTNEDSKHLHYGYYRDDPNDIPGIIVSNNSEKSCEYSYVCDSLCSLVSEFSKNANFEALEQEMKAFQPFRTIDFQLDKKSNNFIRRKQRVNAKTFNKIGIVVPVDPKTEVGYRPINFSEKELKKLLDKISQIDNIADRQKAFAPIHEEITYIQFANDESDFGMGLELGINLFLHGSPHLHKAARHVWLQAYTLLNRQVFSTIAQQHIQKRSNSLDEILGNLA